MFDHQSSGDATVSAKSQFASNDSVQSSNTTMLDLLMDGRNLDTRPAENTADKYLAQLFIDVESESSPDALPQQTAQSANHESTLNESAYESTDRLILTDLNEVTLSIFDDIDADKNGHLTKEELAVAVQDDSYKGQEAQALTALYASVKGFQRLNDDEWFSDETGITRSDAHEFDYLATKYASDTDTLRDAFGWSMSDYDRDQNGRLSFWEVGDALYGNKQLGEDDRRILTYLENNYGQVRDAHDDHEWFFEIKMITPQDIAAQYTEVALNSREGTIANFLQPIAYRAFEMQSPEISRELFADAAHPERSVTPDAIDQGRTGDCYFLAALAAVAQSDPQSIVQMIKDNQDGTFTVNFPGKQHPITVDAPTDTELGLFNGGSNSGIWASVLEKAYGKYVKTYYGEEGLTDIEAAGNGGYPAVALEALTGAYFRDDVINYLSDVEIVATLIDNFRSGQGKPMTVSTARGSESESPDFTKDGFARQHAYTVLGAGANENGEFAITIRNPWGDGDDNTSGTVDLTLEQFMRNFTVITYEF